MRSRDTRASRRSPSSKSISTLSVHQADDAPAIHDVLANVGESFVPFRFIEQNARGQSHTLILATVLDQDVNKQLPVSPHQANR
jgi:hypothetical protein